MRRYVVVGAVAVALALIAVVSLLALRSGDNESRVEGRLVGASGPVDFASAQIELFTPRVQSCNFRSSKASVAGDGTFVLPVVVTETDVPREECVFDLGFRLSFDSDVTFVSGKEKGVTIPLASGETHQLPNWNVQEKPSSGSTGSSGGGTYDREMCEALQLQYDINKRLADDGYQEDFTSEYQRFKDFYNCP